MSDELRQKLRLLEDDYPGQPLVAQRADLREINRLRAELGLSQVDAHLKEVGAKSAAGAEPKSEPKPVAVQDHTEARAIYRAYRAKRDVLDHHREYAERVVKATSGPGQTPVRPLATMGTDGGPLLCDHCNKPIVLEGGQFHGVTADVAWKRNPTNWNSWILGGMVVEIQTNGTLRIYHGYPGRDNGHCCNVASREDTKARDAFGPTKAPEKRDRILAFLKHEFPNKTSEEQLALLNDVLDVMYSYDPGLGVNRPPETA